MIRTFPVAFERARQTLSNFDNGPTLLAKIAMARMGNQISDLEFRYGGLTIVTPNRPGARVPVYEVFVENAYSLDWFLDGLSAPSILDIGGHVGCFSIAAAMRDTGTRVFTYEATPSTYRYLKRNVSQNNLDDQITAHNVAISATNGTLSFADRGPGSGHNGVLHLGDEDTSTIEVPCVSINHAFHDAGGAPTVVKIDAEGAEYDLILASDPADWDPVSRVVMEYHGIKGHHWSELETFFVAAGLKVAEHIQGGEGYGLVWLSREDIGPRP